MNLKAGFADSADYDVQASDGLIEGPVCGSASVRKAVMAPSIGRRSNSREGRLDAIRRDMAAASERAREYVEKNFDYVGDKFPEEARKIHYGETEARGIFGEASGKDVKEMVDEGVPIAPLPGAKKTDKAGKPKTAPATPKKLN